MNYRFILREMIHSRAQGMVFVLCVALSCLTIVSVSSLGEDIRHSVVLDGRSLHGGDLIIHSHYPFRPGLEQEIREVEREPGITTVRTWEFYSMARNPSETRNVLSSLKVVEGTYPLYGEVRLVSGRQLSDVLAPGKVVVGGPLLERLQSKVGDSIHLGDRVLEIAGVVSLETSRPVEFFNFGPRIFVHHGDLSTLKLLSQGSRARYELLMRVQPESKLNSITKRLQAKAVSGEERVATFEDNRSPLKRFYDNLLFFLSLISLFIMILAGISMGSCLDSLFRSRRTTLGAMRALGATGTYILSHYLVMVILLALTGIGLGLVAGIVTRGLSADLFSTLLPAGVSSSLSLPVLFEGVVVGLLVVLFFTLLPLLSLKEIRPTTLLGRGEENRSDLRRRLVWGCCLVIVLAIVMVFRLGDLDVALWMLGGMGALFLVIGGLVRLFFLLLGKRSRLPLSLRQAVRSLMRKGNATQSIVITLSAAMGLLFSIFLLAANLRSNYVDAYPEDAPKLFCIDIQPDQQAGFLAMAGETAQLYPVVRARLKSMNGRRIGRNPQGAHFGDSLAREFNLSYRASLLDDEMIVAGKKLYHTPSRKGVVPVSLLDQVASMGDMKVGDLLEFNIQGVPLLAEVSSIRSRTRSMLHPFFYFIFPPEVLETAPRTFFAALDIEASQIRTFESSVVEKYPNVTTINVVDTARRLEGVAQRFFGLVTFFASFAFLAGGLVFVSSLLATRMERIREAVYYTVLGSGRGFVLKVFLYEHLFLAGMSAGCGILVAELLVWGICRYLLEVPFKPFVGLALGAMILVLAMLLLLGIAGSRQVLRVKPVTVLRELD